MKAKSFLRSGEPLVNSYQWEDIASGEGIIEFCGFAAATASATFEYLLTTNKSLYSANTGQADLGGFSQKFEVQINNRMILNGTAYLQIPIFISVAAGGSSNSYVVATIYHYNGTTETAISSSVTSEHITTGAAGAAIRYLIVKVPITKKIFSKGDKLRVGIVGTATGTGTRTQFIQFVPNGIDPQGSSGNARLSAFIPVEIEI